MEKIDDELFNNGTKPLKSYNFRSNLYYNKIQTIACLCTVVTLCISVHISLLIVFPKNFIHPTPDAISHPIEGAKLELSIMNSVNNAKNSLITIKRPGLSDRV